MIGLLGDCHDRLNLLWHQVLPMSFLQLGVITLLEIGQLLDLHVASAFKIMRWLRLLETLQSSMLKWVRSNLDFLIAIYLGSFDDLRSQFDDSFQP